MLEISASSMNTSAYRHWCHVANSMFDNSVSQVCPLVFDASLQFVDI